MQRRDTEKRHPYSESLFRELRIGNLQGLLKEGESYSCGIEAYQVTRFEEADLSRLDAEEERGRFLFCRSLGVPYLVILASEVSRRFRVLECVVSATGIDYMLIGEYSERQFALWWRSRQSFEQTKDMYDAGKRISGSLIDEVLFANRLAWGVNVDGFMLSRQGSRVMGIFEKRIRTRSSGHGVDTYDPNRYFNGTRNRRGDRPSWEILHSLAVRLGCGLFLMTFDSDPGTRRMGVAGINEVTPSGLAYSSDGPPTENLLSEPDEIKEWLRPRIMDGLRR
jgi:hypothetical protein